MNTTKLSKYVVYFSSMFLTFGCTYTLLYYDVFDIKVFQYISLQEGVLEFVNNSFTFVLILASIPAYFYINRKTEKIIIKKETEVIETKPKRKIQSIFEYISLLLILFLIYLFTIKIIWFRSKILQIVMYTILMLLVGFYPLLKNHFTTRKNVLSIELFNICFYSFMLFYVVSLTSLSKAYSNMEINFNNGTEIYTNDSIIFIKDNLIIIGKTDKYIFLRDFKDNTNIVIPMEQVKLIKHRYNEVKLEKRPDFNIQPDEPNTPHPR